MTSIDKEIAGNGRFRRRQAAVAQVWSDVLQIGEIDVTKNFFDLGGDSLKAIEVISRLQALLNVEVPLIAFFEDPTIAHLAAVADELLSRNGRKFTCRRFHRRKPRWRKFGVKFLQAGEIEATQNFFDLGGDSLKAIEVISRLQALLNVEVPLIAFFEDPTIAHLAAVADELRGQSQTASPSAPSATIPRLRRNRAALVLAVDVLAAATDRSAGTPA